MAESGRPASGDAQPADAPAPAAASAQAESIEQLRERTRELEGRLTSEGRSKAQTKGELERERTTRAQLEQELNEARRQLASWEDRYEREFASPEERERIARQRAARDIEGKQASLREAGHWRAIANATPGSPLHKALSEAAQRGKFFDADTIDTMKVALSNESDGKSPDAKKEDEPPKLQADRKVTPKSERTIEQIDAEIADAQKKRETGRWLQLKQERQAMEARAEAAAAGRG